MVKPTNSQLKRIPLKALINLYSIRGLDWVKANIPTEVIEANLDQDMLDVLPSDLSTFLSGVIAEQSFDSIGQQLELSEQFGDDIVTALSYANNPQTTKATTNLFCEQVLQLESSYQEFLNNKHIEIDSLTSELDKIEPMLSKMKQLTVETYQSYNVLKEAIGTLPDNNELKDGVGSVIDYIKNLELHLNKYYEHRLYITSAGLHRRKDDVNKANFEAEKLNVQIKDLMQKLRDQKKSLVGKLTSKLDTQEKIRETVNKLTAQRAGIEIIISEKDLIFWLDVLVDASMVPEHNSSLQSTAQMTRLSLFTLLEYFCTQQERSAKEVKVLSTNIADAKTAADFFLRSEEFVLEYFIRKQHALVDWMGDAARRKLGELQKIKDEYLAEIRQSA